jgi:hypothetical protein
VSALSLRPGCQGHLLHRAENTLVLKWNDFEHASNADRDIEADYIVTRNPDDFMEGLALSPFPTISWCGWCAAASRIGDEPNPMCSAWCSARGRDGDGGSSAAFRDEFGS